MTKHPFRIFLLGLFLALSWTGQVFAFCGQGNNQGAVQKMAMADHDGLDMAGQQMDIDCPDCQSDGVHNNTLKHCLKNADKTDTLISAAKVKAEPAKAAPSGTQGFRTFHNQINGPNLNFEQISVPLKTQFLLRVRLRI